MNRWLTRQGEVPDTFAAPPPYPAIAVAPNNPTMLAANDSTIEGVRFRQQKVTNDLPVGRTHGVGSRDDSGPDL